MKRIILLVALLMLSSTVSSKTLYFVTCIFNGAEKVYSADVDDVNYFDYGLRIDMKDGTIIRYALSVPCEYKKVTTR